MKIKRRKKKYSGKLFNELILFYLLNRNSYFFEYEASSLLNVSSRTLRRYINEINETCVLNRRGKGLEAFTQNRYKSYHVNLGFFNKENNPSKDAINSQTVLLPIGFCQKHPKGLDSFNQHIVRLTRCALLLHYANNEIRELNECKWKEPKDVVTECAKYYFVEMNFDVSLKTFKRDMYLVVDVINFMKDK